MRPTKIIMKIIGCCMIAMLIIAAGITPTLSNAASNTGNSQDRFVTIDFNNVDINVFIKFISELTGKNFIVDQRVRGNVTIISPIDGSPAAAANLQSGDVILKLDNVPVKGMSLNEAIEMMRGPKGSEIVLMISMLLQHIQRHHD